nr:uncharacterized protein LOC111514406 [Leptinotarsa decemlineata]
MMSNHDRVSSWITEALQNEDVIDYKINIKGTTGKSQGYVGDIIFADVCGIDCKKQKKDLHLVIKQGKTNKKLRETFPIKTYFEREMFVYNEILPLFTRIQKEKKISDPFNSFPKCFKTMIFEDTEVIILENGKPMGYELLSSKSMNLDHMKFILKQFSKYHALSFALRDQNENQFDKLTSHFNSTFKLIMADASFINTFRKGVQKVTRFLRERNESDVSDKLEKKLNNKDPCQIMDEVLNSETKESVILHGDNWINNFIFRYKGCDKQSPTDVLMLDWQFCSLHSPVLDLSYFIYANSSKYEMDKFDDLMKYYHAHFSVFLRDLGSDPQKLFPFSALLNHWRKYGAFAAIWVITLLDTMICDEEDAPSPSDFSEGTGMGDLFLNLKISDEEMYKSRLVAIINHYCNL